MIQKQNITGAILKKKLAELRSRTSILDFQFALNELLQCWSKPLTKLQKMRLCIRTGFRCKNKYCIKVPKGRSKAYSFIGTSRVDAMHRFSQIRESYAPTSSPVEISAHSGGLFFFVYSLTLFLQGFFSRGGGFRSLAPLDKCIILGQLHIYRQLEQSLATQPCLLEDDYKLWVYSEHDSLSSVLLHCLQKNRHKKVFCFMHGMPYLPVSEDLLTPSAYCYTHSYVDQYLAWNELAQDRLTFLLKTINKDRNPPEVCRSGHNPYASDIVVKPASGRAKLVLCLSNSRWNEENLAMLALCQNCASAASLELVIKPHPSLSKTYLKNFLRDGVAVSMDRTYFREDLHISYHTSLYFSFKGFDLCHLRYSNYRFDSFGDDSNIFSDQKGLYDLVKSRISSSLP